MKKIELTNVRVDGDTIRYEVREEPGLGLLRQEKVELFIRYHFNESFACDLSKVPISILALPVSLYMIPITYFYDVELIIPEMDKELYERLSRIYAAYSKIYGPFKEDWRGKIVVKKVVENHSVGNSKYDKVVFFSGGVDACHAGINNSGQRSLLVSIPDIERMDKNRDSLQEKKISLMRSFAKVVNSDWLLISNNFNASLFNQGIDKHLAVVNGLSSPAFKFDGWGGIKYVPNMCSVAPVAYLMGIKSLIMGSAGEVFEGRRIDNLSGVNPEITNSVGFANVSFAEQEGLDVRRSKKVLDIVEWCKRRGVTAKLWVCFADGASQCGFCGKCVRTQLNVLCAGEDPGKWGFGGVSEKEFNGYIRQYRYLDNPYFLWDNIETIEEGRIYPYQNALLHWLKKIGYKEYVRRANNRAKLRARMHTISRVLLVNRYPRYVKTIWARITGSNGITACV